MTRLTPQQQLDRLKAAFPGKYVIIKCEINNYTDGQITVEFVAYSANHGHRYGHTLNEAVEKLISDSKPKGTPEPENVAEAEEVFTALEPQPATNETQQ